MLRPLIWTRFTLNVYISDICFSWFVLICILNTSVKHDQWRFSQRQKCDSLGVQLKAYWTPLTLNISHGHCWTTFLLELPQDKTCWLLDVVCVRVFLALHHSNCVFTTLSSTLVRKPTKPQTILALKSIPQKATLTSITLGMAVFWTTSVLQEK